MSIKILWVIIGLFAVSITGVLLLPQRSTTSPRGQAAAAAQASGDVISSEGVHWHPELTIIIKGQKQIIPANIGIGMQYTSYKYFDSMMGMTDMHTHDASGTLHWEIMQGPVKAEDARLGNFFAIWGKTFNKDCIFESCNGQGGTVKMFVNGKANTEFDNYQVKDKDTIEIRYE